MSNTAQNGKGSKRRPEDDNKVNSNWDYINWASKQRKQGRAEGVMKDKTKYSRKVKHKGQENK